MAAEFSSNSTFINLITRKYMLPTVVSILGTTLVGFANSLLAGYFLGSDALAGINIVNPITFIFSIIGCIINIGGSIGASVEIGKENTLNVYGYVSLSLILTVVLSIIATILGFIFLIPFIESYGATGIVYDTAVTYGYFLIFSGVLVALMYYYFNYIRIDGRGSSTMAIFILMSVIDIVIAYILLKIGYGVVGLGYAVVISYLLADIIGMFFLFKGKGNSLKLGRVHDTLEKTKQIWKMGAASGINNLCNLLRTITLNVLILKYYGIAGLGIFAVVCAVINFTQATVAGAGQTVGALVGVFYGEKDRLSIRTVLKAAVRNSILIQGATLAISILFSGYIVKFFGINQANQVQDAIVALILVVISLIPGAINNVFIFYLSAVQKTLYASVFTFLRAFGLVCILIMIMGESGVGIFAYSSFFIAEIITLIFLVILIVPDLKRQPDCFDLQFSMDVDTISAVKSGEKISDFLEDKENIDSKIKMAVPLALEELLVLIYEHTHHKTKKSQADVRLNIEEDEVMLRIRCEGEIFDPLGYYLKRKATLSKEDLLMDDSLGIGILVKMCDEVRFERTFGVNNLVILIPNGERKI